MKPAPFDYLRADSIDEVLETLAERGDDARIIAGGQSLMPMLNMRLVRPEVLVDISRIDGLGNIVDEEDTISIGATVTQGALGDWEHLGSHLPIVAQALPNVGHFQTRNRGTVCGSLCHADPSSELPLCLALLDGEVELMSAEGIRQLSAEDFQQGILSTAKEPTELVTKARYPKAASDARFSFHEFHHRHGDFAVVAVAAMRQGESVRLAVGGVAERPEVCHWENLDDADIDDALNDFAWALGGSDDIHATAQYRRHLVRHLGRQAIEDTAEVSGAKDGNA